MSRGYHPSPSQVRELMAELAQQLKVSEQHESLNRQLARGGAPGGAAGGAARTASAAAASRVAASGHASSASAAYDTAAVSSARLANMAGLARPIFRSREPFGVG